VQEQEQQNPEDSLLVQEAVRRLPERERHVLVNRYGLEKGARATVRELSEKLGISEKAVRRVQRRAEHLLKALLESGTRGGGLGEVTI
jgi:RNA polymerase sigma factor (sigma-70 family)